MKLKRVHYDVAAICLHTTTFIIALCSHEASTFTGQCITAMEAVACMFHASYILRARAKNEAPRIEKWFEFAISTTLATIAIIHIDRQPQHDWILLLAAVTTAQQIIGIQIDKQTNHGFPALWPSIVATILIQTGTYAFIRFHTEQTLIFYIYALSYAIITVHGSFALQFVPPGDYMEQAYVLFGTSAKLAVSYSVLLKRHPILVCVAALPWFAAVALATTRIYKKNLTH